jgi:hypothetical protein
VSYTKPRYSKVATTELKPIRNNGKSSKKIMIEKPYFLRPMYNPTNEEIEALAGELIEWSARDTSLRMSQFYTAHKLLYRVFWSWCKKYPVLQDAYDIAMSNLAEHREIGGLTGKLNATMVVQSLSIYDKDWKEMYEWKAKLQKQDDNKNTGPQIVVIERAPNSDIVPERKKKDE